jgi:hypothetical protein
MPPIRRLAVAAAAALSLVAFAPAAQAGPLVSSATGCQERAASQVFLPWADVAQYVAAPGATAESRKGWTLAGGAGIVDGNEPWNVVSASDSRSLGLPAGAIATTDAMCVGITHPTLRFFVDQGSGGAVSGGVDVEVLYEDALGDVRSAYVGSAGGYGWHPTAVMVITPALMALLPGEQTAVAFRFSARGGDFRIDDVHVDPWGRN